MNARKDNPKVGDLIEICFEDHCEDSHELMHTRVWGKVVRKTRRTLVVRSWEAEGEHNCKDWAIDRRTVEGLRVIA